MLLFFAFQSPGKCAALVVMSDLSKPEADSGLFKAAAEKLPSANARVRLLVAIPAVIVLLMCLMAGIYFWMADAYLANSLEQHAGAMQEFTRDWLFFLVVFVIAGAIVGYMLAWSLTQPIQDIIRLSERVAGGDLRSKVNVTRQDEMGELGSSFNNMVESLNHFIETRNKFILESFTGGLVVTDLNGTITAVNSSAENLLGVRNTNVSGKSIREVFANPQYGELLRLHDRVIWKQETVMDHQLSLAINGRIQSVLVSFTTMRDSAGDIFGVIINVRDQVEMEKFYQNMRNTDRLATMGTFASGLAHEIRNPLGAIKGTAQLLLEDLGPNHKANEYLHIITKEVNRLDTLIREVQAYSQPALEKVPADLNRLIDEIISLAQSDSRYQEKPLRLEQNINPLPSVHIAKNQFRQALLNIVINAIQAVPEEGMVRVVAEHNPTSVLPISISVSNEGLPIPADVQQRMFEPFFTTKAAGTGLGLSIAFQVAANHGGKLSVKSEDGWNTFTFQLPEGQNTCLNAHPNNVA